MINKRESVSGDEELNYQCQEMARSLSKQKNNTIGIILPQIEHPYFAKVLGRLEKEASKRGYRTTVFVSKNKEEREEKCLKCAKAQEWQE